MTRTVEMSTTELRNNLGEFVAQIEKGTTVLLTKHGRKLATVAPARSHEDELRGSVFGCMKGEIEILDETLTLQPEDYGHFHLPSGEEVDVAK